MSFHISQRRVTFGVKTNSNTLFVYERTRRTHGAVGHQLRPGTAKPDDINKRLEEARKKKLEAFERGDAEGISAYTKEIQKLEREARKMQTRAQVVERTLRNLDKSTPKELKYTIKELNRQLNSGMVERGSAQWEALTKVISERGSAQCEILTLSIRRAKTEIERILKLKIFGILKMQILI